MRADAQSTVRNRTRTQSSDCIPRSLRAFQNALGHQLAREYPVVADLVIAVPDSGVGAALGLLVADLRYDAADVDLVVIGTPIDLRRVIDIRKPAVRVRYDLDVLPDSPQLADILAPVL